MSRSGKMTLWAPTRCRIEPCWVVIAFAQIIGHAQVDQRVRREDAGLDVVADRDDGHAEVVGADLAQHLDGGGVGLDDRRQVARDLRTTAGSESMASTSCPRRVMVRARACPNRPSPMTRTCSLLANEWSLLGIRE